MKIVSDEENIRIDKYLSDNTSYSRQLITKLISSGNILVNGKNVKNSYKVKLSDEITIDYEEKQNNLEPENIFLNIVYEDEYLLVINKPSGMVVHPGSGNFSNTLVNALLYYYPKIREVGEENRPGIVHRLDKDTSGLMMVAKTNDTYKLLVDDFKNKKIKREYTALLEGNIINNNITINAPIGRDDVNFLKKKVISGGKSAITHLKVLNRYKDYTLVNAYLETGRTHQIRVHTAYIGNPVFNDPLYGSKKNTTEFGQFLHSSYLEFVHPITKELLTFTCDLPDEFKNFIDKLD